MPLVTMQVEDCRKECPWIPEMYSAFPPGTKVLVSTERTAAGSVVFYEIGEVGEPLGPGWYAKPEAFVPLASHNAVARQR